MADVISATSRLFNKVTSGKPKAIIIDTIWFRLHYRITSALLLLLAIMLTARQYFGDVIRCSSVGHNLKEIANDFCWISGTFNIKQNGGNDSSSGYDEYDLAAFPGEEVPVGERMYHHYYQWTWVILYLQALGFYLPHLIWKVIEGGNQRRIASNLSRPASDDNKAKRKINTATAASVFPSLLDKKVMWYAVQYVMCETVLNLVNLAVQIWILNNFVGPSHLFHGLQLWKQSPADDGINARAREVFPYLAYCAIPFQNVASTDEAAALCVLPGNALNRRIFMMLWCWYLALAGLTLIGLIFRGTLIGSSRVREHSTSWRSMQLNSQDWKEFNKNKTYVEWFMLDMMKENVDDSVFCKMMEEIQRKAGREAQVLTGDGGADENPNDDNRVENGAQGGNDMELRPIP